MEFDWEYARTLVPILAEAALINVYAGVAAFALALVGGLLLALGRLSTVRVIRFVSASIVEFVRDTPFLIQLFFIFFALPRYGLTLSPILTGILALGLHLSSYTSEVYRAGIATVPRGQWDAAVALNFSTTNTWRRVILPQSIPPTVPAMGNYLLIAFKDTAILATISVSELLGTALGEASQTFKYVEALTLTAIIFLVMSSTASVLLRSVEARLSTR